VIRTRVGYAGGTTPNPTYERIGDHTETLQIDFDPATIGYDELLEVFWAEHDPGSRPWSRQYMAAIFYHDDRQRDAAVASRERVAARRGIKVVTEVLPVAAFTLAEDYHQKYYLRGHRGILREFKAMYPRESDFVASTAAARANGYLSGYGNGRQLDSEIDALGLSAQAQTTLRKKVGRTGRP
jgi:methionine-S-sulfoxide reductase